MDKCERDKTWVTTVPFFVLAPNCYLLVTNLAVIFSFLFLHVSHFDFQFTRKTSVYLLRCSFVFSILQFGVALNVPYTMAYSNMEITIDEISSFTIAFLILLFVLCAYNNIVVLFDLTISSS